MNPAWSPDGAKLYFITPRSRTDRTLMVVDVTTPMEPSPPRVLFDIAPELSWALNLTPDGEGFLALTESDPGEDEEVIDEIIVVENFFLELERVFSDQNK